MLTIPFFWCFRLVTDALSPSNKKKKTFYLISNKINKMSHDILLYLVSLFRTFWMSSFHLLHLHVLEKPVQTVKVTLPWQCFLGPQNLNPLPLIQNIFLNKQNIVLVPFCSPRRKPVFWQFFSPLHQGDSKAEAWLYCAVSLISVKSLFAVFRCGTSALIQSSLWN